MPLHRKLLLSMLIPAALLGLVGAMGVYSLRRLEASAGRILADNYRSIQETRRMEQALRQLESLDVLRETSSGAGGRENLALTVDEALRRCEGNITETGETAVLKSIRSGWNALRLQLVDSGNTSPTDLRSTQRSVQALYSDLEELVSLNEKAMIKYERETSRVARVMLGAVTATALAAIVALAVFAMVSARRISRPVTEVADRLHVALNPDFGADHSRGPRNEDEIARLRQELDALLDRLARYEDEQNQKLFHLQGRLAFVMDEVLEGLVLIDGEHRVLAMNRIARMVLGPHSVEGVRLDDLDLREDVRQVLSPFFSEKYQIERDLGELRWEVDGAERIYRPRVLTVSDGDGTVEGYLLLFWDATEQRRFEESRRRFISMLSHQLKTPMTSLTMSVNLLREKIEGGAPAQAELLSIATENCNSLSSLISDLIEAARDAAPDLSLKTKHVDILRLLRSALRPLVPQAEEKGISLLVPTGESSIMATVDPVKFPWVVTNIAGNALRYTDCGGRIDVAVKRRGNQIEVSVKDTGAGIPPEDLDRIFQPHVSLEEEPRPGTHGLGLAIAKEIMEAHGGSIEAASKPGEGTEFKIRFPA
jgi:NtrC-family two-component system sensor histidine kinase KinB